MPLVTFPGGIWIPSREFSAPGDLAYTSYLCDANGEKLGMIIQAPKTGTISKVGWRTGTVTSVNGASSSIDVRIETVSATTGNPTGTLWATNTNGAQTVVATDDDHWFLTTLTAGAAVVQGELLAVVVVVPASTNLNIVAMTRPSVSNFPYVAHSTAAYIKDSKAPCLALEYNDGVYYQIPGCYPFNLVGSVTDWNSGSSANEYALKFRLPFNATLSGFWYGFSKEQNVTVRLYDSGNNIRLTRTLVSTDYGTKTVGLYDSALFSSTITLKKNVFYRLGVAATAASPNLTAMIGTCDTAAIMGALDGGADFHQSSRGGLNQNWVDKTTGRPFLGLILSRIDTLLGTI